MADGLCAEDAVGDIIEKTIPITYNTALACETKNRVNGGECDSMDRFYLDRGSDKLFNKLYSSNTGISRHDEFSEDDFRKKRCVDRYDSSESSDSGVAVLSCTDCSGSSSASSDLTDPGSPFSPGSNHSDDSGSQPIKMPPTQIGHHSPWSWTTDEGPPIKRRSLQTKTTAAFSKKATNTPSCLTNAYTAKVPLKSVAITPILTKKKIEVLDKSQQGKITGYFKSQMKPSALKKELSLAMKANNNKVNLVDQQTQFNSLKTNNFRKEIKTNMAVKRVAVVDTKSRKSVTVPRKILPAPSKVVSDNNIKISSHPPPPQQQQHQHHHHPYYTPHHTHHLNHHMGTIPSFAPTVTLTALGFPSNLAYLHTKAQKPSDNIFLPQYTTITDKINTIPIINQASCLNMIPQPMMPTTINNFNCVKLNATVVPIMNINSLPSRINGSGLGAPSLANFSVETAMPTVLAAKPKTTYSVAATPKQQQHYCAPTPIVLDNSQQYRTEEPRTNAYVPLEQQCHSSESSRSDEKSPSPISVTADSDSGFSSFKECLEVRVSEPTPVNAEPQQKSPILSPPKTIRFPPKQPKKDSKDFKTPKRVETGLCRWTDCNAQLDTSGALLEHLQLKHVISQVNQEHYVCSWQGCKVQGRTSCSRSWLERHVLAHAGTKPFRCIVDGCGQRFNSQIILERHVNSHFNSTEGKETNGSARKSIEGPTAKLLKRNGKKIRFRRQPWSARMFDFFDIGIMEGLQHKLISLTQKRSLGQIDDKEGDCIHLQSQILARRIEQDGTPKVLVKWHPVDIVPDEWVNEKEFKQTKQIPIPPLSPSAKDALKPSLFPTLVRRAKHRRKPISKQT